MSKLNYTNVGYMYYSLMKTLPVEIKMENKPLEVSIGGIQTHTLMCKATWALKFATTALVPVRQGESPKMLIKVTHMLPSPFGTK